MNLIRSVSQGLQSTKRDAYGRLILGDIITSVNGKKVANGSDLYRILDQCKVGDKVLCKLHFLKTFPFESLECKISGVSRYSFTIFFN